MEISRSAVRLFRAVLKKIAGAGGHRDPPVAVVFRADRTGVRLQARNSQIALEFSQPGSCAVEDIALPADALADFESRKDSPVRMETNQNGVVATWQDKAVPQIKQYDTVEASRLPQMPPFPTRMDRQPVEFLGALRDASATAGTDVVRFAVNCLQLRGHAGQVVSTDGRQMLAQSGFTFAWDDEVLIPASPVFGCRELHGQEPFTLGRTDQCITLSLGAWTLHLVIEKHGRFPNVETILAGSKNAATVLQLDPADAEFLLGNLGSLPGAKDDHSPVTIEANGQVLVRSQDAEQPMPTEVTLARSNAQGRKLSIATDRHYLAHALRLGFQRISITGADQPAVCRDDKRQYVWQILGKDAVLKASEQSIRLSSAGSEVIATPAISAPPESEIVLPKAPAIKEKPPVQDARAREVATTGSERTGIAAVLAEAEAIKDLLRQAYTRTHQLVAGVKRYRRQAQAVKSALGSLRQLREVAD